MESDNDWIEDQCCLTSMTDTGQMFSAIKSDRKKADHGLHFGGLALWRKHLLVRAYAPAWGYE